jgi:iron complex outermembrane recepter protein
MRTAVLIAAILLTPGGTVGQDPGVGDGAAAPADTVPAPVYRLGGIEATVARGALPVDRVPFAITLLESTDRHIATPAVDLQELLRRVPGVVVGNRHNLAMDTRVVVRGFGARSAFGVRGVRILLDGIPLTLPDGQAALTNVDPGSIGRVEVIRGPAAALYGNAAGGVIALSTVEPPPGGLLEARAAAGTYGTGKPGNLLRLQANAGGTRARDSWFVGLSHLNTDGFRDYSRAQRSGLSARYRRAVGERSSVSTVLNVAVVPLAENPGALPLDSARQRPRMAWPQNVTTGSSKEVSQTQGGVAFTHDLGPALFEAAAYGLGRSMDNPLPFGRYIRLSRTGGGARALLRAADDGPISWTAGLEAQTQRDDRVERDNIAGEMGDETYQDRVDRVASLAPFAFAQLELHPRLAVRVGGRYDAVVFDSEDRLGIATSDRSARRVLDAWSASTGARVDVGQGVTAFGSVSTWFQTPTTTELINAPPQPGQECCQTGFNPDLEPQDGWGWEAGLRGGAGPLAWEVTGFDLRVRNEILPFQVEGVDGRDFYRNAGRSVHRGVEVGASAALGRGWGLGLAYAYSGFRFDEPANEVLAGNRLPGIPPHRLDGWLARAAGRTTVELELEWVDRAPVNDANTAFAPAYAVVDVRLARQTAVAGATLEPFVAVTNVLDARYSASVVINAFGGRYHEPGPGRGLLLGMRVRFW